MNVLLLVSVHVSYGLRSRADHAWWRVGWRVIRDVDWLGSGGIVFVIFMFLN